MSKIVVLSKSDLSEVIEQAVALAIEKAPENFANLFPAVMSLTQVCQYTQYSRSTILKFVKEKNFPVVDKCDSPRFVKSEVDKWLKGEI